MVTNDERVQRYAEAIGWRRDIESGAIRAMLDEQVQRVMAVADAEQAELRTEIDALPYCSKVYYTREKLRAEAAEAKVARVEALMVTFESWPSSPSLEVAARATRAALAGDA